MSEENHTHRHRGSVFFPVLLIVIGAVLLFGNMGLMTGDFWANLIRFWPVLLIVSGLDGFYRREGLVGATFITAVGTIFLLANLGVLDLNIWQIIVQLWPLLLVAVGFDVIIGRRSLLAGIAGAGVMLVILFAAIWGFGIGAGGGSPVAGQEISQSLGDVSSAMVTLDPAVGELEVEALSDSPDLISGMVSAQRENQVRQDYQVQDGRAEYRLYQGSITIYTPDIARNDWLWQIGLTPEIPLDLRVNMGAGRMVLDLSDLELENLDVNSGVGSTEIHLPAQGSFSAKVDGAIGQLVITVPAGMALRIKTDTALTTVQIPSSYTRDGDFRISPGYASAENRIDLQLDHAIGLVVVQEE